MNTKTIEFIIIVYIMQNMIIKLDTNVATNDLLTKYEWYTKLIIINGH